MSETRKTYREYFEQLRREGYDHHEAAEYAAYAVNAQDNDELERQILNGEAS